MFYLQDRVDLFELLAFAWAFAPIMHIFLRFFGAVSSSPMLVKELSSASDVTSLRFPV